MLSDRRLPFLIVSVALVGLWGCGSGGPRMHPVAGKIELASGDIGLLAGSHIEAALDSNLSVRSSGEIRPDGVFVLETLQAGTMRRGAAEGHYRIRLILGDDDPVRHRQAAQAVATRYLQFQTSGLELNVPTDADVVFRLAPR